MLIGDLSQLQYKEIRRLNFFWGDSTIVQVK